MILTLIKELGITKTKERKRVKKVKEKSFISHAAAVVILSI